MRFQPTVLGLAAIAAAFHGSALADVSCPTFKTFPSGLPNDLTAMLKGWTCSDTDSTGWVVATRDDNRWSQAQYQSTGTGGVSNPNNGSVILNSVYNGTSDCDWCTASCPASKGNGTAIATAIQIPPAPGTPYSITFTAKMDPNPTFTAAYWTYVWGTGSGTGPVAVQDQSMEIDFEVGTQRRYTRNGDLESDVTAIQWPVQSCAAYSSAGGYSANNVRFTTGAFGMHYVDSAHSACASYGTYTTMSVAMDVSGDGTTAPALDLNDGGSHTYTYDSDVDATGKGILTFSIDDIKMVAIAHTASSGGYLEFYNSVIGPSESVGGYPAGMVTRRYFTSDGEAGQSLSWDASSGSYTTISAQEFVGIERTDASPCPPGAGVYNFCSPQGGINAASGQVYVSNWLPKWGSAATPPSSTPMTMELTGVDWQIQSANSTDVNNDGTTDSADLTLMFSALGTGHHDSDLNGQVGIDDLLQLINMWGTNYNP